MLITSLYRGDLGLDVLLARIEERSITLLQSPPITRNPLYDLDPAFHWLTRQWKMLSMQPRQILEECMTAWRDSHSAHQRPEWPSVIHKNITDELARMQMQPQIMESYRRFVVIRAPSEARVGDYHHGVRRRYL
jgi:hypothetical protein